MAAVRVKPTKPDVVIARTVSRNTNHRTEMVSRGLTWGADEKILLALATVGWFATRGRSEQLQRAGNHALLVTLVVSLMPDRMKRYRSDPPDRKTVLGHMYGVYFPESAMTRFPWDTPSIWGRRLRRRHFNASPAENDPSLSDRSFPDADSRAGALG